MVAPIPIDRTGIAELCRRHRIRRLSLFGSIVRGDFGPGSDVDMLVEFEPGYSPGWDIVGVEDDFSRLFGGRKVDIVNPRYLNHRLREPILREAVVQFEASDGAR